MASSTQTYDFTYDHTLILSGLIVAEEIEISGRARFAFTPGRPATGPSYSSGGEPAEDPEIEIDEIELAGHPASEPNGKLVYATLAPSDPLYSKIEAWLLDKKFADLCEAVTDPREDYADYFNDMRRDDALLAAK